MTMPSGDLYLTHANAFQFGLSHWSWMVRQQSHAYMTRDQWGEKTVSWQSEFVSRRAKIFERLRRA